MSYEVQDGLELVLSSFMFLLEFQLWESPDVGEAAANSSLECHKY